MLLLYLHVNNSNYLYYIHRYFYSYQPLEKDGPNNNELCMDPLRMIDGDSYYYFWYDTYPMEFAVFLLDSALARGIYFHTMCANDAFYERSQGEDEGYYYYNYY